MKILIVGFICVVASQCALCQRAMISAEENALLDRVYYDKSFTTLDRRSGDVADRNSLIQKAYRSYAEKSSEVIKIVKREQAGFEGQYVISWLNIDHGKVDIIEDYFGDPSGSKELQWVHEYKPDEIWLGTLVQERVDTGLKFVPLKDLDKASAVKQKDLYIGFKSPYGDFIKWF
jgi:hypothetical protein